MVLVIATHSGKEFVVEVEAFDESELVKEINDTSSGEKIAIGRVILSKIDIKGITPKEIYESNVLSQIEARPME